MTRPTPTPPTEQNPSPRDATDRLVALDRAHVWHPFTAMDVWRAHDPLVIERGEGFELIDTRGNRYIDGVSSLWCNVHGHRVPEIDRAVRDQLDRVAHTTLLGLANAPSAEFAAMLARRAPGDLNKVFYSDAGATAVEVGFKMAVGYWFHRGKPDKRRFIGLAGAYHGDTTGAMSVGYSELFHKPFVSMVFDVDSFASPDPCRPPGAIARESEAPWPSEDAALGEKLRDHCLGELERMLQQRAHQTAAVVIEPMMQGAAGMICQPPGFMRGVAALAKKYDVLLIADEVATGFGRTGRLFAVDHENLAPDILCLAKGISGGYLPLAATLCTDAVEAAFGGPRDQKRTLYHGHTYTGNPLACAAAIASLKRYEEQHLEAHARDMAALIRDKLDPLRDHPHVLDVRQRGLMVGMELGRRNPGAGAPQPFDFSKRTAAAVCESLRPHGLLIRPLGDVIILMPAPAMDLATLGRMLDITAGGLRDYPFDAL